ncbi:hypothetical protein BpHYR1_029202 [Brachionus plicatilis]|uniref:Uncharacterized protein n=1 Tax=Brachionus plicatilis TaxID=10195 RepID=A0A3M7PMM3_BRAPC|nr:hypothetical protein BpHYR1_029202 [Brachionus plicatilis]
MFQRAARDNRFARGPVELFSQIVVSDAQAIVLIRIEHLFVPLTIVGSFECEYLARKGRAVVHIHKVKLMDQSIKSLSQKISQAFLIKAKPDYQTFVQLCSTADLSYL